MFIEENFALRLNRRQGFGSNHIKKKSTLAVAKNKDVIWSWLLRVYSDMFLTSSLISIASFIALPEDIIRHIISYLPLSDRTHLFYLTKSKQHSIFHKNLHAQLNKARLIDTFIFNVTLDSPKNKERAVAILRKYPQLASQLISTTRITHQHGTGHFLKPMSAFVCAWCFDDNAMCHLLEQYLDEDTKNKVWQQCYESIHDKFIYLIAREGENNQNKVEAMLVQYPDLITKLISKKIDLRDTVRHFMKPMSAYEYAYWAGDTRMRRMLNKYINKDESLKSWIYEQCKNIEDNGVEFEMLSNNGRPIPYLKTVNSPHFDFQPLIEAYKAYTAELYRLELFRAKYVLRDARDRRPFGPYPVWPPKETTNEKDWHHAKELCLKVASEWTKVPIYAMQELCSMRPYYYITYIASLSIEEFTRTVKLRRLWLHNGEHFVYHGLVNSKLGISHALIGCEFLPAAGLQMYSVNDHGTYKMITALSLARTGDDCMQTLIDLTPTEPQPQLMLA